MNRISLRQVFSGSWFFHSPTYPTKLHDRRGERIGSRLSVGLSENCFLSGWHISGECSFYVVPSVRKFQRTHPISITFWPLTAPVRFRSFGWHAFMLVFLAKNTDHFSHFLCRMSRATIPCKCNYHNDISLAPHRLRICRLHSNLVDIHIGAHICASLNTKFFFRMIGVLQLRSACD